MSESTNLMLYDANKKSPVVAYLLLIFLGGLGAHRFYVKRHGTATLMLILNLLGWAFLGAGGEIAVLPLVVVGVWLVIDLFLTRGLVRSFNHDLIRRFDSP